jgi:diguanylate cyclase (GGDEF)-like protein
MRLAHSIRLAGGKGIDATVPWLLYAISVYGVPLLIAAVTVYALVAWDSQYATGSPEPVAFRVVRESVPLDPRTAEAELAKIAPVDGFDTHLSDAPFWFEFGLPPAGEVDPVIELTSRHGTAVACWGGPKEVWLGQVTRQEAQGSLLRAKSGFVLDLAQVAQPTLIVCRGTFQGPAHISILRWSRLEFAASVEKFHRDSGLLDGGLGVLAAFVLLTAFVTREWLYVIFAAWLVANLRMAAISAGWDGQWLEHAIPWDWMIPVRKLTAALYYVLTVTLFSRLFHEDLKRLGSTRPMAANQWSCLVLLVCSVGLPFRFYLPVLWLATAFNVSIIVFLLVRILAVTRSRVAMWYAASLTLTLSATLYEVFAAALGIRGLINSVNSVTAGLFSSVIVALAIAEQMRQEHLARIEAQTRLQHAYDVIPIGLFTLDRAGFFTHANPAFNTMMGAPADRGGLWSDYFGETGWRALKEHVAGAAHQDMQLAGVPVAGGPARWFLVGATLANERIEGSVQDITERVSAADKLSFLADHDPLTGILNRRGIERELSEAINERQAGRAVALAYLDLDRFKLINDLFGHGAGDEVLKQVCARATSLLGNKRMFGRVGGDEFVVVFQDETITEATAICRALVERIGTLPYQLEGRAFQIKGSIGVVELGSDARVAEVISLADRACREAKKGQCDGLVVYGVDAPAVRERNDELRLVQRFGSSGVPEGLFLLMQPIMSISDPYGSLDFEVLLRLREADQSVTPAGKIIGAAEANGRIAVIDRWVLSKTLAWMRENELRLAATRFVCVNLSGGSLNDERFVEDVYQMLDEAGPIAQRLCIEITESVALQDLDYTRRFIERTRSFGTKIALDDFGAGYTSFSYLRELPADAVKIDGTFVKGVQSHPANLAIVAAIVELARNLGMKSIAEWVEDCGTLHALAEVGVDYIQGYAIAVPQDPEKILVASSSASFIRDPQVAQFVRDSNAKNPGDVIWPQFAGLARMRLH